MDAELAEFADRIGCDPERVERVEVPDGSWCISGFVSAPTHGAGDGEVGVHVISDDERVSFVQWDVVEDVVTRIADVLDVAADFLGSELRRHPERYQLAPTDRRLLSDDRSAGLDLDEPGVVFQPDGSWSVHWRRGALSLCEPWGVVVAFEAGRPTSVDDLRTATEL